jgi:hypothetical protein
MDGEQEVKVVLVVAEIVVTMVVTLVLERKETQEVEQTFLKRVDKGMAPVREEAADVAPQEIQDKPMVEDLVEMVVLISHMEVQPAME